MIRDRLLGAGIVLSTGLLNAVLMTSLASAQATPVPPDPSPVSGPGEVLARGPIHEAFAEPIVFNPDDPGLIVPRRPPDPIAERAPDQQPAGRNVVWIAGYWAWDDARADFIWISGLWRDIPPGRQWVPGYWAQVEGGYRWVSGSWTAIPQAADPGQNQAQAQDAPAYLPAPPESLEVGPNLPCPGAGYFWAPGCWMWQGDGVGYAWQPGYWTAVQTSWIWVPPHYAWTPCGVLFVPGYWDYTLPRRGLLFAPVAFPATVYVQPAFVYTPVVVVQQTVLVQHLFCRPSYGHYYFGDYYDPGFRRSGFVAWFEFGNVGFGGGGFGGGGIVAGGGGGGFRRHGGFDPIYAQAAAVGRRDDPMWERRVRTSYERRVADPGLRPAQTYLAARREMALRPASAREASLVAPLAQVAASNPMNLRLERVDAQRREAIDRRAEALRTFQSRRIDQETRLAAVRAEAVRSRPQAAFSPVAQPARLAASPIAAPMPTPTPTSRPTPGAAAQAMIAARDERLRAYQEQVQRAQAERTERASAAIAGRSAPSPMPLQPRMQPQATPIPRRESTPGAAAQAMIAARDERLRAYQEQMRRAQAERASPSAAAGRTTAIQPQIQPRIQPQAAPTPRPGPTPGAAAQTAASARAERLKAYQERVEKAKSERPARPR